MMMQRNEDINGINPYDSNNMLDIAEIMGSSD